jgi:hypothetical protein
MVTKSKLLAILAIGRGSMPLSLDQLKVITGGERPTEELGRIIENGYSQIRQEPSREYQKYESKYVPSAHLVRRTPQCNSFN